ncbi:MAG TPA: DUF1295 domain-containing protein [Saprospiraceae bacterium]|nr:DUF1295 domain-containing protein [Saprospiraceae bacterium]HMX86216.1 DUF1295 domain-containing protein [Saprospiraceae bacterium]HMZ73481.1 DUF1295 domain-containing protein [Saprospiraceae bacterium]HNA93370.1 DUF1295 domain-containing protein [Saprospiraceae bacterium]HNE49356.1 DUF1295 domain-containing protein [Saprospiraceae bacterium]
MSTLQYQYFLIGWMAFAIIIFIVLMFITAPYGRHSKTNWGPMVGNRLGWVVMEMVVLLVLWYFIFKGKNEQTSANVLIISMFTFHYFNRSFIFPLRLKTTGKKMPLAIMFMGIVLNIVSGFTFGYYFGNLKVYENQWLTSPEFIIGTLIFVTGLIINWRSDALLIGLRKQDETGYKIPYGGLFKYVSCPNLLGETIEWGGFAILTWSLPGLAFFVWTFANLIPRAIAHHRWYKQHFSDYPEGRKAVIPFLW